MGTAVGVGVSVGVGSAVGGSDCGVAGIEVGIDSAPPQPNSDSINIRVSIGKTKVTRFNLLPLTC